jgi:DNA-directed RNA polymerase specialized sigma subunit
VTPKQLLFYVALGILAFNILTVRYRRRNAERLERKLRDLAQKSGREITIQEISEELKVPVYDAKILLRKFISQGKMEVKKRGEAETYYFKS